MTLCRKLNIIQIKHTTEQKVFQIPLLAPLTSFGTVFAARALFDSAAAAQPPAGGSEARDGYPDDFPE